jgi:mannitol/fructose-specific phosphotransferase system IIA component (Ntr-type)
MCGKPVVIEPSLPTGDAPCPHCGCLLWFPKVPGPERGYGFRRFSIADASIRTKRLAITAILDRLVAAGVMPAEHLPRVLAAVLKREELGSTGIGRGVAVPHAKYPGLATSLCAIAEFKAGVDFDSPDGQPVHVVCLILSPTDLPSEHLKVLEAAAGLLSRRH